MKFLLDSNTWLSFKTKVRKTDNEILAAVP